MTVSILSVDKSPQRLGLTLLPILSEIWIGLPDVNHSLIKD
jgi:hypothetical protein